MALSASDSHDASAGRWADEGRLVAALRARDERAFAWLVRSMHPGLVRYAGLYLRDRAAAEEAVQDTWIGVIRGIDRFAGRSSLRTWIFQILANRARTTGRREARSLPFSALAAAEAADAGPAVDADRFLPADGRWAGHWSVPPRPWNAPEADVLAAETRAQIEAAIAELPPAQREVITLRDVAGLDAAEVCAIVGVSDGNQRVLLHRARSRVRTALEAHLAPVGAERV